MKYFFLTLVSILLTFSTGYSQKKLATLMKNYDDGMYFYMNNDYRESLFNFKTLLKTDNPNNGQINYLAGMCCLHIPGENGHALTYLQKAVKYASKKFVGTSLSDTTAPLSVWFFLGNAYRIDKQFDKATDCYESCKALVPRMDAFNLNYCNLEIEHCKQALSMMKKPVDVVFSNLGTAINTGRSYFPAVSENDSVMVFNSSLKFYEGIFCSKKINGQWLVPENIVSYIQSDGDQFVSSISDDGKTLLLRKEGALDDDIYMSHFANGRWTKSQTLGRKINTKNIERNASISSDGRTIYFSSDRKGGNGALDIYKAELNEAGEWSDPVNLGKGINTEFNDDAPVISADGKRLYFASQGHMGMGGYDWFYSDLMADGTWSDPVNIGYPLNTADNDIYLCPVLKGKVFYTSFFSKEKGNENIFRVEFKSSSQTVSSGR